VQARSCLPSDERLLEPSQWRAAIAVWNDQLPPYGEVHAAAKYGHYATAHMARFGTTPLSPPTSNATEHAVLNKKAVMRKPLTLEEHQSSRWVVYPYPC
jgi:acetyl-CoA acetyltransferase